MQLPEAVGPVLLLTGQIAGGEQPQQLVRQAGQARRGAAEEGQIQVVDVQPPAGEAAVPGAVYISGKAGEIAADVGGHFAPDDMVGEDVPGGGEGNGEGVADFLEAVQGQVVRGFKGVAVQLDDLEEFPVFGGQGGLIDMAGVGQEIRQRFLLCRCLAVGGEGEGQGMCRHKLTSYGRYEFAPQ